MQKGVCTCEGSIWIVTASGYNSFHTGRTPSYIPVPHDGNKHTGSLAFYLASRNIPYSPTLSLGPCFAQVQLSWACLGRDL